MPDLGVGRELDAMIALRVMDDHHFDEPVLVGAVVKRREMWWKSDGELMEDPPRYSTDIAAAWRVFERLCDLGWSPGIAYMKEDLGGPFRCDLYRPADGACEDAFAATAPHAICLAALQAVSTSAPTEEHHPL